MKDNFAANIEKACGGEAIIAIVIGSPEGYHQSNRDKAVPPDKRLAPISWDEARPLLDYEYDSGFGGADCHPICAWTESRIIFVSEYDGSTTVQWLPRNPIACDPGWSAVC